jgi:Flp pilus assembly protein TadG
VTARVFRALRGDERGVALVEFAIILPVMLVLYLGGVQLQDAMACKRKVTITARAAVDLIAQNATGKMTKAEIQSNLVAASQVMQPYVAGDSRIRVSEVSTDATGNTKVVWSQGLSIAPYAPGQAIDIPAAMKTPNATFLLAQVNYPYRPPTSFGQFGPMTLGDTLRMVPRNTDQIACSDCSLP